MKNRPQRSRFSIDREDQFLCLFESKNAIDILTRWLSYLISMLMLCSCAELAIKEFEASPLVLCPGADLTVTWKVENSKKIWLYFPNRGMEEIDNEDSSKTFSNIREGGEIIFTAANDKVAKTLTQPIEVFDGQYTAVGATEGCRNGQAAGVISVDTHRLPLLVTGVRAESPNTQVSHELRSARVGREVSSFWNGTTMAGSWDVLGEIKQVDFCPRLAPTGELIGDMPNPVYLHVTGSCSGEIEEEMPLVVPAPVKLEDATDEFVMCNGELVRSEFREFTAWHKKPDGCIQDKEYRATTAEIAEQCAREAIRNGDFVGLNENLNSNETRAGTIFCEGYCKEFRALTGDVSMCLNNICPEGGVLNCSPYTL